MINKFLRQIRKINQIIKRKKFKKYSLNYKQSEILEKLKNEGIYKGKYSDLKELEIDFSWLDYSNEIIEYLDQKEKLGEYRFNRKGSYVVGMQKIPLHIMKKIYDFTLNKKFIEIFENYFCLPLHYKGADIRKDINDGQKIETRLWHIDSEDEKIIKILFYLNKVDTNGGPFTYIKKNIINKKHSFKHKTADGRIKDETMNQVCDKKNMLEFTNENYNFAIVDTANIFHKGKLPEISRYSVFFCYNSKFPLQPSYCYNFQEVDKSIIEKNCFDKVAKYK